jgi:hypothetical protein
MEALFQRRNEVSQPYIQGQTHTPEFEQVESALAGFILADEGLGHPQAIGEVLLPQAGILPSLSEKRLENRSLLRIASDRGSPLPT